MMPFEFTLFDFIALSWLAVFFFVWALFYGGRRPR
jgi:hypothetical protein